MICCRLEYAPVSVSTCEQVADLGARGKAWGDVRGIVERRGGGGVM